MCVNLLIKIASADEWAEATAAGTFTGTESDNAGFIHLSSIAQLPRTANKWFFGRRGLVLLVISPSKLRAELRWEPNAQGELFPHVYGAVNLDAVVSVIPFEPLEDGTFETPPALSRSGDPPASND